MALESCKILILSHREIAIGCFFCIREKDKKTDGWSNFRMAFPSIFSRPITFPATVGEYTDLMPINLVKFNQTETEE